MRILCISRARSRHARWRRVFAHWIVGALVAVGASCAGRFGLDGSSEQGPPATPPPPAGDHPAIGLVSAAGAPGMLRVDWRAAGTVSAQLEIALFVGPDPDALLATQPIPLATASGQALVRDLPSDARLFVALGMRRNASDAFVPSGPVLAVHTGAPVFVDAGADPAQGDGASPETAFHDLLLGISIAQSHGGGNVWVMEGDHASAAFPLPAGVHVSGGFRRAASSSSRSPLRPTRKASAIGAPELASLLARRDPLVHATRLAGAAGQPIFVVETGASGAAVLDGFALDGGDVASAGVDDTARAVELRSLSIRRCQRGIKLRPSPSIGVVRAVLAGVTARECALEGLSVDGPFDLAIEQCHFDRNQNEGADLDHLIAPDGAHVRLAVRASTFASNGTEGLDVHLGAAATGGLVGGEFDVDVSDCDFVGNALDGLRIDVDYEGFPAWRARIAVRGAVARANRGSGLHLDLDAAASVLVHRSSSSANALDGLSVTSESFPGTATVSASLFAGNLGAGVRASGGHFGVLASHCIVAGNRAGGLVSELVPALAVSSVAYLQPDAWIRAHGCADQSFAQPPPFERFAREFCVVVASHATGVVLASPPDTGSGAWLELDDDGIVHRVESISATSVTLWPVPGALALPASAALFDAADARAAALALAEDVRLTPNSVALGAGMSAPSSPPGDAGIFAAPFGGVPGREDEIPPRAFALVGVEPPWTAAVGSRATFMLSFGSGTPDARSVGAAVFVVNAAQQSRAVAPFVDDEGRIVIEPPPGGWSDGDVIELCDGLRSTDGRALLAPVAIPIATR